MKNDFRFVTVFFPSSILSSTPILAASRYAMVMLLFVSTHLNAQIQFEQVLPLPPAPQNILDFEGVAASSFAFADVDGDGDQDVLITGQSAAQENIARLYLNEGSGNFSLVSDTPFDGVSSGSIAFADVDGDGDLDVLITGFINFFVGRIAKLYTNDGSGNYTLVSGTPFEGVNRGSISFADVDGDNDLDVLITGQVTNGYITRFYTNDGSGNYTLVSGTPFENVGFSSSAFADVDGDGDQDVLITGLNNSNLGTAKLYINDGIGGYTLVSSTPFEEVLSGSIVFADVDGDGDHDVLTTGSNNAGQRIAKLYTNDGSGNYTLVSDTPFEGVSNGSISSADVDGDGDQDVLITGLNSFDQRIARLYANDGSGNYTLVNDTPFEGVLSGFIGFADVDGDDDLDVLITGSNTSSQPIAWLYTNDGSGNYTWASGTPFEGVESSSIAFADADGDGDQDALITGLNNFGQRIARLYTNDGSGNYTLMSGTPFEGVDFSSISFADVDGDGDQDVLVTGRNSSSQPIAQLYTNDGTGGYFLVNGTPFDGVFYSSIAFADVDGDGDQDVLITGANIAGQRIARLYTNDGSGNYTLVGGTPFEGVDFSSISFADVDGDGDQDVLITGRNTSNQRIARLYTNDGSGGYTLVSGTPFEGVQNSSIAFADVDGDDDQDVLITGSSSNDFLARLYTNDGSGNYALESDTPFEELSFSSIAFADIDGDGDTDVLISGMKPSAQRITRLYTNDGSGGFSLVSGTPVDGVLRGSIAFADVDGDNDPDLLIAGGGNNGRIAKLYRNFTPSSCAIIALCIPSPYTLTLSSDSTATLQPEDIDNGSTATCGTPILTLSQTEFDTTHIGENTVTLTVTDENGNTDSCQAIVTVMLPDPCRYFMSNYNAQGGSDVYELTLNENENTADLGLLVSVPQRVNLAFDNTSNQLYLGRESNSVFQTINPDGGALSLPIGVNVGLSGFMGAAFGPDGKLYAASGTTQGIYRFEPATFQGAFVSGAQIQGGDIAFTADGALILVSRNPAKAFLVNENSANTILGPVPAGVSGLAGRADGTFLLSVQGMDELIVGSSSEGDTGVRFQLQLNGTPFTPANGDLASGCPVPEGAMIAITDPHLPTTVVEPRAVLTSQPNPTEGISVVTFTTETGTRAALEVYDVSGRSVATLFNAEVQPGQEYRAEFNGSALPNGVYVYRLTTDAEVVMEKFIIAR